MPLFSHQENNAGQVYEIVYPVFTRFIEHIRSEMYHPNMARSDATTAIRVTFELFLSDNLVNIMKNTRAGIILQCPLDRVWM